MSGDSADSRKDSSSPPNDETVWHDGTQFLLGKVGDDETNARSEAWGRLSKKVHEHLRNSFSNSSFPRTIEFDDFVNDVMLKILESIDKFEYRGNNSFRNWVLTLASNVRRDSWRKHNREEKLGLASGSADQGDGSDTRQLSPLDMEPTQDESPTQIVRFRDLTEAELDCVSQLSEKLRQIYTWRRRFDLSFAEISERSDGAIEATLRSHYKRAREKVGQCLSAKIDDFGPKMQGL